MTDELSEFKEGCVSLYSIPDLCLYEFYYEEEPNLSGNALG